MDLETKLDKARNRERRYNAGLSREKLESFDVAANIAREVVAEKDAEIARLEAILSGFGYQHKLDVSTGERVWFKCVVAEPPKVTDAQRELVEAIRAKYGNPYADNSFGADAIRYLLTVIESTTSLPRNDIRAI
jgi:hypothetical protein